MEKLKKLLSDKDGRLRLILILGLAGIVLIAVSDMLPEGKKDKAPEASSQNTLDETEQYRRALEEQLTAIISETEGAGRTAVMLTLSAAKEYVYAEKSDTDRRSRSEEQSVKTRGEPVLNGQDPLLRTILVPKISGAAIVCEGAGDPVTRERVIQTVSAVLGLPSSRISVQPFGADNDTTQG